MRDEEGQGGMLMKNGSRLVVVLALLVLVILEDL